MNANPATTDQAIPSDIVLDALDCVVQDQKKTGPNKFFVNMKKHSKFNAVAPGLATKGNGSRIYARVCVDEKWTWKSTETDDLELAVKWKADWDRKQWLRKQGFVEIEPVSKPTGIGLMANQKNHQPKITAQSTTSGLTTDQVIDTYVAACHPIIKKRRIRPKAPKSIENERRCFSPIRVFFGTKNPALLTLADCDAYHVWRNSGGYVSKFTLRGHPVEKKTRGGDRAVDLELIVLSNALELAVRHGHLTSNPIRDRGRYADEAKVRHCREVAPTPEGLVLIVDWMTTNHFQQDADITRYLAYSGLRLGEGLRSRWPQVKWADEIIDVRRSKKGVFPFVLLLPELKTLLRRMKSKAKSDLIFPSPFNPLVPRDDSSYRRRLAQAAAACGLPHVIPHGLRSYFVTQARQSGLTDAEIAQLIGDKTGPSLIAEVYGDVRPDHLLAVARKIKLTAQTRHLRSQTNKKHKTKKS